MENLIRDKRFWILIIGLLLFNLLIGNWSTVLWDEDEAAYAGFALEMVESGDWLIPDFIWSDHHRKPPFHFWSIAVSYHVFGVNEWATRFPMILFFLLFLWSFRRMAAPVFGASVSLWATVFLMSNIMLINVAKIAFTDTTLLCFQTICILALFNYMKNPHWKWNVIFWGAIALGMLTKGPPVLILGLGAFGFLFVFHKSRKRLLGMHPWFFLPLAALPLFLWGYLAWQKDGGEMVQYMIDFYVFKRVSGDAHVFGQTGPPGYFLVVVLLAFLPFLSVLFAGIRQFISKIKKPDEESLFLISWLLFGWFFYEIMPSKLPSYVMGGIPAFAIIAGQAAVRIDEENYPWIKWVKGGSGLFFILSFGILVGLIFFGWEFGGRGALLRSMFVATILWGLAIVGAIGVFARRNSVGMTSSVLFGMLLTGLFYLMLLPLLNNQRGINKKVALEISQTVAKGTPIIFGEDLPFDPGLGFYIQKYCGKVYRHEPMEVDAIKAYFSEESPLIIMTDAWRNSIAKRLEETGQSFSLEKKIEGLRSEDFRPINYWIVYPKEME